jgi:hypothetical protein
MQRDTKTTLDDAAQAMSAVQYGANWTDRVHFVLVGHTSCPLKLTYMTKAVGMRKPDARFKASLQKIRASK